MAWHQLTSNEQVDEILEKSFEQPQLFFKHSTRCSISSMAFRRFEQTNCQNSDFLACHFLDLLSYRVVSNYLAEKVKVMHQSPQIIVVKNGEVIVHESHGMIDGNEVLKKLA